MVRAEAPSELCQEPGAKAHVLGPGEALGGQGLVEFCQACIQGCALGRLLASAGGFGRE
jgi:hypothetical protein